MKEINYSKYNDYDPTVITHNPLMSLVSSIIRTINNTVKSAEKYKNEVIKVTELSSSVYTQEYKNTLIQNAWDNYLKTFQEAKTKITDDIDEIEVFEKNNEKIMEYDDVAITTSIAAAHAAQGNLPDDVIKGIIDTLNGRYKALNILYAIFMNYAEDEDRQEEINNLFADYISVDTGIMRFRDLVMKMEQSPDTMFISLYDLLDSVIHFGKTHGLKLDDVNQVDEIREIKEQLEPLKEEQETNKLRAAMELD